jgi:hypothetical protein
MIAALVRAGELASGAALGASDEALSQGLLYVGIVATAGALGGTVWLLLSTMWAAKRAREKRRFTELLYRASRPASTTLPAADLAVLSRAPLQEASDRCDLYSELGDTAPVLEIEDPTDTAVTPLAPATVVPLLRQAEVDRGEESKEEDFFDGDTQVEVGPLTATA